MQKTLKSLQKLLLNNSKNSLFTHKQIQNFYEAQQKFQLSEQKLQDFKNKGIAVLPEILDPQQLDEVINYTKQMIKKSDGFQKQKVIFSSGNSERGQAFIQTGDKIHYFFENLQTFTEEQEKTDALDFENKIALNKIAHAQHDLDPFFEQFSYQQVFKNILQKIGYKNPRCVQSMYIFKNPKIGGEVGPHTDNTFLTTTPLSCMGIWIALHDATIENGCLYALEGSHKKATNYFMVRTEDQQEVTFIGEEPKNLDLSKGTPLQVKRGSIVLIDGNAVHYSYHNASKKPRHAFTLHFVEGEDQGYKWSEKNWMQRGKHLPFRNYYEIVDQVQKKGWQNYIQK
ncbi:hypothetical protein PPERSA_10913 [Pseudocohnilembus persalinus]|uniref:Fe2OG dioxygenase domain-containing protein n=1 Tax=Pseudocohnilembus persalinus TaxID=266149 RepID=A0A0V0RA25_PSEPJ|nr:hypothetical protein PPERSA_10913 [Pseudocohnilembus persalinus]|eukprot:KRX11146.1 hypothetical protein PPERSA_10913 [Pseudocohnilembus persalinus]